MEHLTQETPTLSTLPEESVGSQEAEPQPIVNAEEQTTPDLHEPVQTAQDQNTGPSPLVEELEHVARTHARKSTAWKYLDLSDIPAFRKRRGWTQSDFWHLFGISQSGGSRYEGGRTIPHPTLLLLLALKAGSMTEDALRVLNTKI